MTEVINNGGPAFPSGNEVTIGDWRSSGHSGMNLRDYFANSAMQAIMSSDRYGGVIGVNNYQDRTASDAYAMADAMLKAR